jgi:hypothetical protein
MKILCVPDGPLDGISPIIGLCRFATMELKALDFDLIKAVTNCRACVWERLPEALLLQPDKA